MSDQNRSEEPYTVMTLAFELPGGGSANRSWQIDRHRAEELAIELGEPFVEQVLSEAEMRQSRTLIDAAEMPGLWMWPDA